MIRTDQLSFSIGDFQLRHFNLEVREGQYFVLLGPPGSGKTVFLECLCGLKQVESGRIYIDGRDITGLEPRERNIGYVPQDYALFPHLSVRHNIEFGLRTGRCSRETISDKVTRIVEMLDIGRLLDRDINGLSGGEKQHVALARALVLQPKVLLLDEPVCALDEATRQKICGLLRRIQDQLGLTTIHVSHNLEEAFSVADQAAILRQGVLQQAGALDELLRKPKNEFIARFMRCENIFCGEVTGKDAQLSNTRVKLGDIQLQIPGQHEGKVTFTIRPEDVLVFPERQYDGKGENEFCLSLVRWRHYGSYVRVELDGPVNLVAHLPHGTFAGLNANSGANLTVVFRREDIHVLTG
jgi:ABC-type Fe3+/spermidine/putrescine transport system ATPase subunit